MNKLHCDIAIIGGGNAALCAAITAAEMGAHVMILEAAPKPYRGGNSRHTRNFRCRHDGPLGPLVDTYAADEYYDDLLKVTKGNTQEDLAKLAIERSADCLPWMQSQGVRFQPPLSGTLSLARTNAFFLGGGKALVNAYYNRAEKLGVTVHYDAPASHVEIANGRAEWVDFQCNGKAARVCPKSVVIASGGFQGDIDWLARAWGQQRRTFLFAARPLIAVWCCVICWIKIYRPWAIRPNVTQWRLMGVRQNLMGAL